MRFYSFTKCVFAFLMVSSCQLNTKENIALSSETEIDGTVSSLLDMPVQNGISDTHGDIIGVKHENADTENGHRGTSSSNFSFSPSRTNTFDPISNTAPLEQVEPFTLTLQTRNLSNQIRVKTKKIYGSQTAIVVMDMGNGHWCDSIMEQVKSMTTPMNKTLAAARQLGISVVFSPSGVTDRFDGMPQRETMKKLPHHTSPRGYFNPEIPLRTGPKGDGCTGKKTDGSGTPWTEQHPDLNIRADDYITEDTQELYNLCREKGITTLLFMGLGTNMNLLERPTGLIAMARAGLECAVVRDLSIVATRAIDDPHTEPSTPDAIIPYIEKYVAPTISANQLFIAADINDDIYKREYGKPLFTKEEVKNYVPKGPTKRFRHLCYDYNWVGRTLSDLPKKFTKASPVEYAEFSKKMNMDAALVLSVPHPGYTTYDSEVGVKFPALKTDWFGEVVKELHKRNISAFGYITVGTNWKFMRDHVGKEYINAALQENGATDMRGLCFNAPGYLDLLTDYTKEVLENYPVDAIRYDMFFTPKHCTCSGCEEFYKEIYNEDFTTWDDILKKHPKRQGLFNLKTLDRVAHKINETGMATKPSVERWQNHINTYEYADVNLGRLYDVAYIEFGDPFRLLSLRGILNKDAIIVGQTLKSPIRRLIMALGARCYQYVQVDQETALPPEKELDWFENDLAPFFKMVSEVQPYLENAKLPTDLGVIFSENTRYHLPGLDREPYMKACEGIVMKYLDRSVPAQFINCLDLDIQDLNKYRMIMLPRTSGLTKEELIHLKNYVREGGNLLVTGDALLFNETGGQRNNFSLAKELGLQYEGMIKDSVHANPGIKHSKLKKALKGETVQLANVVKTRPISGKTWVSVSYKNQMFPLVHSNTFGKGKMVYVASSAATKIIEQVGNVLTGELSITVSDPKKQVILSHQEDQGRYILHLLGDGNYSVSIDKKFADIKKVTDQYPANGWNFTVEQTKKGVQIHVKGDAENRLLVLQ